jgi:hypothetical protein
MAEPAAANLPEPDPDWPEPSSLGVDLPPVQSFTEDMLAEKVRAPLVDIARRMRVLLDFVAVCFIVFLSGCLQRRARMLPQADKDEAWEEVFNLSGGIVARSGMKKSPVMRRVAQWIYTIQEERENIHTREMKQHKLDSEIHGVQLEDWRKRVRAAIQEHGVPPDRPDDPVPPAKPLRIIANDTTVPAAQELLVDNPAGIILLRDELGGWWINLDRHEENRDFYMTAYSGNVPYDIDRIKRGHRHLPGLSLSIFGATTPGGYGLTLRTPSSITGSRMAFCSASS